MISGVDTKTDILIVGGGIIGCSTAYFLAANGLGDRVVVIEQDPSYARATTPQGAGGVRRMFSVRENILMSTFSLDFYSRFSRTMAVDGEMPDISLNRQGYLFVVGKQGASQLEENYTLQKRLGVNVMLMDTSALGQRFPSIGRKDVALSCYSPDDGWVDPYASLMGFRKKASSLGVRFFKDRVTGFDVSRRIIRAARTESGRTLLAERFVNASGPWAGEVSSMAGMKIPVVPMCRLQHYWQCAQECEALPLVKDENGLFFRPEGDGFVGGRPSWEITHGFIDDITRGYCADYFERVVWPLLEVRVPGFQALKVMRTWAGHYAQNLFDGNMILGSWTGGAENFFVACGFSGHGIMHAPAVGQALTELLVFDRFETMDLMRFSYDRIIFNKPIREQGII
ncbi:MAG: NAD(P)/FAD-dependent oxidoreductase [Desulfomonilia bacterium]